MSDVLFLTNNDNAKSLYEWICDRTSADFYSDRLDLDTLKKFNPKLVVSYNYKYIIKSDVIDYMNHRIINMHISYLPWNKGASPNIWSFIDDTPKGVTIHELTAGLDAGDILFQKRVTFDDDKDTLSSSYEKLNIEIANLFKEHWNELITDNYQSKKQEGKGSYHTVKDLEAFKEKVDFEWSDTIADFKKKLTKAEQR